MADQDQVQNDRNRDLLMLLMGGGLMGATVGKGAGRGAGKIPRRGVISPAEDARQRAVLGEAFDAATQRQEMGDMKRGSQGAPGSLPPPGPPPGGGGAPDPLADIAARIRSNLVESGPFGRALRESRSGLEDQPNTNIPPQSLLRLPEGAANENAAASRGAMDQGDIARAVAALEQQTGKSSPSNPIIDSLNRQAGPQRIGGLTPASSFPPHTMTPNALRMAPPESGPQGQALEEALRRAQADEAAGFPPLKYPDEPPPSGRGGLPVPYRDQPNSNIGRNLAVGGAGAGGAALLASLLKGDSGDNAPAHPPAVMGSDQNTRPPGWDQGSGIRPPQPNRPPMVMGSSQNTMPPGWDPRSGIRPPQPNPQGIGMSDRAAQMGGPPQMDRPPFPGPIPMPPPRPQTQPPPHHKKQMQKGLPSGPISPLINGEIDNRDRRYQPPVEFGNPYR